MSLSDVVVRQCEVAHVNHAWAGASIVGLNMLFIAMALHGLWSTRASDRDPQLIALFCSIGLLAIGSDLFQIFTTKWSRALDMGAIGLFVCLYLHVAIVRVLAASPIRAATLVSVFVVVAAAAALSRSGDGPTLHGLLPYLWAACALGLFWLETARRRLAVARIYAGACLSFVAAIVVRGSGLAACDDLGLPLAGILGIDLWLVACAASIRLLMVALTSAPSVVPVSGTHSNG